MDRESKLLPEQSSNSSLESNSKRAPEPIRKKPVPAPRKLKAAVPPVPKPRSTLNRPTAASQLNSNTVAVMKAPYLHQDRTKLHHVAVMKV